MTVFDTLSQLETYLPVFRKLESVITTMDRSLPYEGADGFHKCPEDDSVTYTVTSFLTGRNGFPLNVEKGHRALVIALDGSEMVSSLSSDEVYILIEGRFLILGEGEWKRGQSAGAMPEECRDVVFTFTV